MPTKYLSEGPGSPASWKGPYFILDRWWANSTRDKNGRLILKDNSIQTIVQRGARYQQMILDVSPGSTKIRWVNQPIDLLDISVPLQSYAMSLATIEARQKAYTKGQILANVIMLETGKTLDMLYSRCMQLVTAIRFVKKRDFRNAARTLQYNGADVLKRRRWKKSWQDNWLEYRYGWLPLIADCESYIDRICKGTGWGTVIGKGKREVEVSSSGILWPGGRFEKHAKGTARARAVGTISHEALNELAASGILKLGQTVWEIIPYSFVIDWFLPVGDWIASLSPPLGWVPLGGSVSWKQHRVSHSNYVNSRVGSSTYYSEFKPCNLEMVHFIYQRTAGTPPAVALPPWNMELNIVRCIDAVGLLANQFKDRSRH